MREPLVTILTPVHNGAPYLPECIESVLRQSYQNWHYVILDNASTDETYEIAKQYTSDARVQFLNRVRLAFAITRLTGELPTNPGLVWEKLRRRHGKAAGVVP